MSFKTTLLLLLVASFLVVGCSDQNDPTQPGSTGQLASAILRGEISSDQVAFEFKALLGEGVDPDQGALLVLGRNLAYDEELGALTVDLSVYNDSEMDYAEPVGLTFVQFMPEDVTILNSDNDESGAGALVAFEFADDDDTWSPGEESEARSVQFAVAAGTSFGFVARIDVGMAPDGGTIGGMVWHDENEDGVMDPDEAGVGGVTMALHTGDDPTVTPLMTVMTGEDGTYRFDGQDAGYYTVVRMPLEGAVGTTPAQMAVILVEVDGIVSDFLLANFGITRVSDPGEDFVKVGDYVNAKGWYEAEPARLIADIFSVCSCDGSAAKDDDDDDDGDDDDDDGDDDDDCDDCDDCEDGCRENDCWGRLAGPITGLSIEDRYLEIMGTPVYFHHKTDWDPDEWHPGLRFRVDATRDLEMDEADVVACGRPKWWNGNRDRVRGFVQEIVRGDDDQITGVVILNTLVEISRGEDDPR